MKQKKNKKHLYVEGDYIIDPETGHKVKAIIFSEEEANKITSIIDKIVYKRSVAFDKKPLKAKNSVIF